MLYEILLHTKCTYARAAAGRQLLRLMPADGPTGQRLIAGAIDVKPQPAERTDSYDFFGNRTTEVCFSGHNEEVEFTVRARVDRFGRPPSLDLSPGLDRLGSDIASVMSLEPLSPHHYVDASPLVRSSAEIADYARSITPSGATTIETVTAISQAIHRDMRYDGEATEVDTPLEEAFAKRRGVCQDFSHIMIACLREIGVPAGYVSGFLRTEPPKGKPRLQGSDSMHAWVQAWCGLEAGWVEFDPTNNMLTGLDHIVAAHGRDYSDVAPVRGVMRTSGGQEIAQSVDVLPLG